MNDLKFKIYTDVVMKDDTGELLIFEDIPNAFEKISSKSKCKGIVNYFIPQSSVSELIPYRLYLRYSVHGFLENVTDLKLEEKLNGTRYEKYVELVNLDKEIRGWF